MGIFNKQNIEKAKKFVEDNRHKVGEYSKKATSKLDQVTNGKTKNVSQKINDAAEKYSQGDDAAGDTEATSSSTASASTDQSTAPHQS